MRHFSLTIIAGLLAAGLAAADAGIGASAKAQPVTCALRARPSGTGVDLTAVATSSVATSGSYRLVVTKRGEAGGSDIEQAGGFAVAAGETSTLSTISMTLEPGAAYDARLTVLTGAGRSSCSRALPLAL